MEKSAFLQALILESDIGRAVPENERSVFRRCPLLCYQPAAELKD
jgi:hypothetical protein